MKRTFVAIGIILLLVGTALMPLAISERSTRLWLTNSRNIITVDDEPGDADFTSVREAVNASSSGDTIEVYSGIYYEGEIRITKENVSLLGISHELGGGNDTGTPYLKGIYGNGTTTADIIQLVASDVTVSNLYIQNLGSDISDYYSCVRIGDELENSAISGCTISECTISRAITGILCSHRGHLSHTTIIKNRIFDGQSFGILVESDNHTDIEGDFTITGNTIIDCANGIYFMGDRQHISGNRIRLCECGISLHGNNNSIIGNDFDNCSVPIRDYNLNGYENSIIKNNFKWYSRGNLWWAKSLAYLLTMLNILRKKEWRENYYDTWSGLGPKVIPGCVLFNGKIILLWCTFDFKPAKEPYEIPK